MGTPHPNVDTAAEQGRLQRMIETIRRRRERKLAAYAKALFLEPDGKTVKLEGQRLIADLIAKSKLFGSSITRDRDWRVDRDEMLRIEGRREIVLRLINLLELGPQEAGRFVEVDDGKN